MYWTYYYFIYLLIKNVLWLPTFTLYYDCIISPYLFVLFNLFLLYLHPKYLVCFRFPIWCNFTIDVAWFPNFLIKPTFSVFSFYPGFIIIYIVSTSYSCNCSYRQPRVWFIEVFRQSYGFNEFINFIILWFEYTFILILSLRFSVSNAQLNHCH